MKQPTIERVLYWMLYFKVIRSASREIQKRHNDLWLGNDNIPPTGILNNDFRGIFEKD